LPNFNQFQTAIAEKFEAMLKLGALNSRMKDFYDIWVLSEQFDFDGAKLTEAIRLTLNHRGTTLSESILPFSEEFALAKQVQWAAFCKRLGQTGTPTEFVRVVVEIEKFLAPLVFALLNQTPPPTTWVAGSTWS
jgi:Nucleotidyl transferase AbiEii toxin, Type IV TA system